MDQIQKRFALLQPKHVPARLDLLNIYEGVKHPTNLDWLVTEHPQGEVMALDFETKGSEPSNPEHGPVGVAFADSRGSCYVDFPSSPGVYERLMRLLADRQTPLIAHNVFFDAAWPLRDFGLYLNWVGCTYATYKLTATEGFQGQSWGLKAAEVDLLGREEKHDVELDKWLIEHGYYLSFSVAEKRGSYLYPDWLVQGKPAPRWVSPNKGEMWRAPSSILGHYAALDADTCWLLWYEILKPCVDRFSFMKTLIYEWYPPYLKLLVRQKVRGVKIDKDRLERFQVALDEAVREGEEEFLHLPQVAPHIKAYNESVVNELASKQPPKWKKIKERVEPPKFLSDGVTVSQRWLKWDEWRRSGGSQPCVSKVWEAWKSRLDAAQKKQHFNLGSGKQLSWLLYDKLGFPKLIWTESSTPATSKDALLHMGEAGSKLLEIEKNRKLSQFCTIVLDLSTKEGTLHPGFRVPGALTGRLAGNRPNLQNQPNELEYLDCFVARPGYKLVTCDVVSLENYVLAELSKDKALWGLYGPDARPGQDAYLYNAAQLPIIGPKIRATGYDPLTATPEDTKRAKEKCPKERQVGKTLTLAANYGAGPGKIHASLGLQGVEATFEEVEEIHKGYWELYGGVKRWTRELERQWKKNGGWVFNGMGQPLGVDALLTKDLGNRVCQSTGHLAFMKVLLFTTELLDEAGVEWYPWICDLHDCAIMEVREDQVDMAKRIMEKDAYDKLNEWLGGSIKLKGEAKVCDTWGDDKRKG